MAAETNKIKAKLANLNTSLAELESLLEPILSQALPEIIIALEPIQQAKLQTVLPYLVYDLVFTYLKANGVNPKSHLVVSELDRVRQYFEKIKNAETPPIKRTELDKDAAGRFIKHAISQVVSKSDAAPQASSSFQSTSTPIKMTTKMIARAQYERTLQRESQENTADEAELHVYDSGSSLDSSTNNAQDFQEKTDAENMPEPPSSSKRRRLPIDPFTGYGEDTITDGLEGPRAFKMLKESTEKDSVLDLATGSRKVKKKKKGKKRQ